MIKGAEAPFFMGFEPIMRFVLLNYSYFAEHPTTEAMDKDRPHAVVVVDVNRLRFAIPLRTQLTHKQGFKTINNAGLDYTKALLIFDDKDISRDIKLKSVDEFKRINEHEHKIRAAFTKYVNRYVAARQTWDDNIIGTNYRYSTLVNYHKELGLPEIG